ncbi:MAG TPA: NAD-dependent epimerase/dehydratase family protein [Candidatus Wujingus californicus]|uniref:NAD-dependent epimerase/dehydratase family protein n=1 Tax=Candidatus Wujingus californicus TaxID=3367618 RepID=UPI00402A290B
MMQKENNKKKILITGGAGYIGSTLVRDALAEGYEVRTLDLLIYGGKSIVGFMNHPRFEFIRGDIRDEKILKQVLTDVDCVVHLAAIVGDLPCKVTPKYAVEVNYKATKLLCEIAKDMGVERFVFASTCSNYGVVKSGEVASEENELNPVSLYAETKIDCEKYLTSICNNNFSTTCLRFGTAFGVSYRTRFDLLINSLAFEAWSNNEIVVFAANTWRPYIHIADISLIIRMVLNAPIEKVRGEIFNAGSNSQNYVKRDVVEILKKIIPEIKIKYIDSVDDRRDYRVNFDKLEKNIGFKPSRSVEDGFSELLHCFKYGILTKNDYETNKLRYLEEFFKESNIFKN